MVLDSSTTVAEAARVMKERGLASALVSERGSVVGIVTERDILYRVVAEGRNPNQVRVGEIMSKPLITVTPDTRVIDAIALMSSKGVRRLVVKRGDEVVGIVSQMTLMGDIVGKAPTIPELELEKGVACPYCGAVLQTLDELSKHIDISHIGVEAGRVP